MKGKPFVFRVYKQKIKVPFLYLECKLQENRYGRWIFKLKRYKTLETTYLETIKQQTKYCWCFYILKCLRNKQDTTHVFSVKERRNKH